MRKLIMLIAMVLSISMLSGCFSFLLAGTDDDSREPSQVEDTRKSNPERKTQTQRTPQRKRKPQKKAPSRSTAITNEDSVKPVNSEGFVEIIPPKEGITGISIDPITNPASYPINYNDRWSRSITQGVFARDNLDQITTVKFIPYLIAETEVTYKLWREVYNWAINHGYKFINAGRAGTFGRENSPNTLLPEEKEYENYPVMYVDWEDCIVWCNAYTEMKTKSESDCTYRLLSNDNVLKDATFIEKKTKYLYCNMTKKGYRLPSKYEWEYAARWQKDNRNNNAVKYGNVWLTKLNSASGADKPIGCWDFDLPSGETWESLRDETNRVAVYKWWWDGKTHQDQGIKGPAPVKTKAPNDCGLYDMSGNALEWVFAHWFNEYPEKVLGSALARGDDWTSSVRVRFCSSVSTLYGVGTMLWIPSEKFKKEFKYAGFRLCKSR